MVEAGANQVPEETLLEALDLAQQEIVKLCEAQEELRARPASRSGSTRASPGDRAQVRRGDRRRIRRERPARGRRDRRRDRRARVRRALDGVDRGGHRPRAAGAHGARPAGREAAPPRSRRPVREQFENDLRGLTEAEQDSKELKSAKQHLLYDRIVETVKLPFPVGATATASRARTRSRSSYVRNAAGAIYKDLVRKKIAVEKRRPDGRSEQEIRAITCEVGVSPRTHGSGLFTRGQTQIMSLLTLGTAKEGQRIDDLSLEKDRRFMHHYNFPPYSVGETGRMSGPKRRDIGHGALAQRALEADHPVGAADFPYTMRIVSETLESNGSSSMGSVCGSTLALMDAGVPIKAPVSGIAMGLVKEGDDYVILTDIQGAEDHLGDMDFKVAGTRDGITALQMDIKITGVSREIMERALAAGEGGARRDPRPDAPGDLPAARSSSPSTPRGSRRSRSTPSTSAW